MGLEAATYVSQLVNTNPLSTDKKSQGDDHLRLIKAVVQNTFPNADRAIYFLKTGTLGITGNITLAVTDGGSIIQVDTSGGSFNVTVPAGLPDGWEFGIIKTSVDNNAAFIIPPTSTLYDGTAKARVCTRFNVHRFIIFSGVLLHIEPPNVARAGVIEWVVGSIPPGYLVAGGQSLVRVDNPRLFQEIGTGYGASDGSHFTLPNLTDRFPVGAGGALGVGALGGEAAHTLTAAEMPAHFHQGTTDNGGVDHTHSVPSGGSAGGGNIVPGGAANFTNGQATGGASAFLHTHTFTTDSRGSGAAHENRPPYFGVYPLLRQC